MFLTKADIDYPPEKLDNTYIETALFSMWRLNLVDYLKVKAILAKQFHIAPSEFDLMAAWEYEIFMKHLNDLVNEENNAQKAEMKRYNVDETMKMANPKYVNKMTSSMMPNMDTKMPNINISMPKM